MSYPVPPPGYYRPPPKKKRWGLIIGLIAGAIALLAVAALVVLVVIVDTDAETVTVYPTAERWEHGDRAVTCVATLDPPRIGSIKG